MSLEELVKEILKIVNMEADYITSDMKLASIRRLVEIVQDRTKENE